MCQLWLDYGHVGDFNFHPGSKIGVRIVEPKFINLRLKYILSNILLIIIFIFVVQCNEYM